MKRQPLQLKSHRALLHSSQQQQRPLQRWPLLSLLSPRHHQSPQQQKRQQKLQMRRWTCKQVQRQWQRLRQWAQQQQHLFCCQQGLQHLLQGKNLVVSWQEPRQQRKRLLLSKRWLNSQWWLQAPCPQRRSRLHLPQRLKLQLLSERQVPLQLQRRQRQQDLLVRAICRQRELLRLQQQAHHQDPRHRQQAQPTKQRWRPGHACRRCHRQGQAATVRSSITCKMSRCRV